MSRRDFLKKVGAVSAASAIPSQLLFASSIAKGTSQVAASTGLAQPSELSANTNSIITEQTAFRSSFLNVPSQYGPTSIQFDKPLPKALSGTLYRNGPALFNRGSTDYHHWFDGDGMIQSFRMEGQSLVHKAAMVQTPRHEAEQEAGRFLWPGFGTAFKDGRSVSKPDDVNVANISLLPVEDELWALWEAGSAFTVDPESLETTGRKIFSSETDGLPFSAHPRVDTDGRIWNFGYVSGAETLVLYDISPKGKLNRVKAISAPNTNMVHDFAVTEDYLVFVLLPITHELPDDGPASFNSALGWDESQPVNIVVVSKSDFEIAHRFEAPAFFAFHFGNAWQDDQQIRIQLAVNNPWDNLDQTIERATRGIQLVNAGEKELEDYAATELVLDLQNKRALFEDLPITGGEFPTFDTRFVGKATNHLTMLNRTEAFSSEIFGFNQLIQFDRSTGRTQAYDFGADTFAEEHIFVPLKGAAEGIGWLVGTHYNWRTQLTSLSVFNAKAVADGPIATAHLPYNLPLGLHGKFVAS